MLEFDKLSNLPPSRFIYAGSAYVIDKNGQLLKEIYSVENTQLNGFFSSIFKSVKKAFKSVGNIVKKVASNPITGVALTAASAGAFGPAVAASKALTVAKFASGASSLVNARDNYKAQQKYAKELATLANQPYVVTKKNNKTVVDPEGTDAIQAYYNYLNAGGKPVTGNNAPDVTKYGNYVIPILLTGVLIAGVLILKE